MEVAAIIVMVIVLLVLAGVMIFLVIDYFKYKDTTDTNFIHASQGLQTEKADRLSNMKYMVDQVNLVNTDIFNTFNSSNQALRTSLTGVQTTQDRTLSGINQFLRFTSNVSIPRTAGGNVSLLDLPGFVAPDIQLIKHVTAVNGLSILDINSSNNNVLFCSQSDPTRCIKFPDANGNTYLTSMTNNAKIVLDAESDIANRLNFRSSTDKLQYASITAFDNLGIKDLQIGASNTIRINPGSGKVGISTGVMSSVDAALHVVAPDATSDIFRAQSSTSTVSISNDGTLNVNRIKVGGPTSSIILSTDTNNKLTITSPNGIEITTSPTTPTRFGNGVVLPRSTRMEIAPGTLVGIGTVAV